MGRANLSLSREQKGISTSSKTPGQSLLGEQTLVATMRVYQAMRIAGSGLALAILQQRRHRKKSNAPNGKHPKQKCRAQREDSGCRGPGSSHCLVNTTLSSQMRRKV